MRREFSFSEEKIDDCVISRDDLNVVHFYSINLYSIISDTLAELVKNNHMWEYFVFMAFLNASTEGKVYSSFSIGGAKGYTKCIELTASISGRVAYNYCACTYKK